MASIGFRPTADDARIVREATRPGESTSDTLRRALRLLDHDVLATVEIAVAHYLGIAAAPRR